MTKLRKKRLKKIRRAVERLEGELLNTGAGTNNWAFDSLYYLRYLALKAGK